MGRLIWFALLTLAVVALWRGMRRRGKDAELRAPSAPTPSPRPAAPTPGLMVRCAHCGLHMEAQDAIQAKGRYFCSVAHLQAEEPPAPGT